VRERAINKPHAGRVGPGNEVSWLCWTRKVRKFFNPPREGGSSVSLFPERSKFLRFSRKFHESGTLEMQFLRSSSSDSSVRLPNGERDQRDQRERDQREEGDQVGS